MHPIGLKNQISKPISFLLQIAAAGGFISLGSLLSSHHLLFDLLSHFRIQYIALLAPALCIALYKKRCTISLALAFFLSVHAYAVYQSRLLKNNEHKTAVTDTNSHALTIMSSNLLASNKNHADQIQFIQSVNPDIVVLQEYTVAWHQALSTAVAWHQALSTALAKYPHRLTAPINSPFGIAIFSQHAFTDAAITYLFKGSRPSVKVTILRADKHLTVFGTHPPPPISARLYQERNQHLQQLSALTSKHSGSIVIAGDLNISPWSDHFRRFLQEGKLVDARAGKGILPTWPAWFAPLQIPIDHIIVSTDVSVASIHTSDGLMSDHKSLWATLEF